MMQTRLYKKLINKAKELLSSIKQAAVNSVEFEFKSIGVSSVFEIFSFAFVMCQHDPQFIEECKNPFIENAKNSLFVAQQSPQSNDMDSIFLQILLYWVECLNDPKNISFIHMPYIQALNSLKYVVISPGKL